MNKDTKDSKERSTAEGKANPREPKANHPKD